MDRSHSEVSEAWLVRARLRGRRAVLLRVDWRVLIVGVGIRVDVGVVAKAILWTRWTMFVVDRSRLVGIPRSIVVSNRNVTTGLRLFLP